MAFLGTSSHTARFLLLAALCAFAAQASAQSDLPNLSTVTQVPGASTVTSASATGTNSLPATSITTDASQTSTYLGLSGLPTLAGVGNPVLVVPDTSGAPFMQKSSLPEGTVFICVGAALGLLGAAILAWRATVAYSIRRSVQRAATASQFGAGDVKAIGMASYRPSVFGAAAGYSSLGNARRSSLDNLSSQPTAYTGPGFGVGSLQGGRNEGYASTGRSKKGTLRTPVTSTLFFSPTANGASNRDTIHLAGTHASTYLPASFYTPGSATSGGAAEARTVPGAWDSGDNAALHSPQTSPTRGPRESRTAGKYGGELRRSRVGMQRQERAPSAYLEDLFDSGAGSMRNKF